MTQNELALQFFQMGFFNPQMTDQALMCLDMMDFDGKDTIMQKVSQNGTMHQKLLQYMQLALTLAQRTDPMAAEQIGADIMQTMGAAPGTVGGASPKIMEGDNIGGLSKKEHGIVANARARAGEASQPESGRVIKEEGK